MRRGCCCHVIDIATLREGLDPAEQARRSPPAQSVTTRLHRNRAGWSYKLDVLPLGARRAHRAMGGRLRRKLRTKAPIFAVVGRHRRGMRELMWAVVPLPREAAASADWIRPQLSQAPLEPTPGGRIVARRPVLATARRAVSRSAAAW